MTNIKTLKKCFPKNDMLIENYKLVVKETPCFLTNTYTSVNGYACASLVIPTEGSAYVAELPFIDIEENFYIK